VADSQDGLGARQSPCGKVTRLGVEIGAAFAGEVPRMDPVRYFTAIIVPIAMVGVASAGLLRLALAQFASSMM